jgi:hypothetical protein
MAVCLEARDVSMTYWQGPVAVAAVQSVAPRARVFAFRG